MEEEWEEKRELWFIRKGFLHKVTMKMCNALGEQYYSQLKNINTAYRNTTPIQILEHLDTQWCPLNVRARKLLKAELHANWDNTVMHITAFGMKLDKEQARIDRLGVIISDKDKLQFYRSKSTRQTVSTKKRWLTGKISPSPSSMTMTKRSCISKALSETSKSTCKSAAATPAKPNSQLTSAKNPRPKMPNFT